MSLKSSLVDTLPYSLQALCVCYSVFFTILELNGKPGGSFAAKLNSDSPQATPWRRGHLRAG